MVGLSFSMMTNEMIVNDSYELIWGFAPEQEARTIVLKEPNEL